MRQIFTSDFWTAFLREASARAMQSVLQIGLIVVLLVIARVVAFRVIDRAMAVIAAREDGEGRAGAAGRTRTLGGLLKSIIAYVLVFIAAIMVLRALGADPVPLLTTAGVLGLAVGFGAQKLVRDVISGFFILLENQYSVGEYVTICAVTGTVEEIGMRTTRLRDEIGRLVIISNGDITQVTNHSRGALVAVVEVSVAQGVDLNKVCAILREVGARIERDRTDVIGPFLCDGVIAMDAAKVTLRLVGHVEPKSLLEVQMDIRERVRSAMIESEIQLA